ncbi:MAG: protein translocase subunit SecF [Acidobacteriota bacterium]
MYIVKNPNFNWLGKKWFFIGVSLILVMAGSISLMVRGLNLGVDFTGGTLVFAKFREQPDIGRIRSALSEAGLQVEQVNLFGELSDNEVQIRMATIASEEAQDLSLESNQVVEALRSEYGAASGESKGIDLNVIPRSELANQLQRLDPENLRDQSSVTDLTQHYEALATRLTDYRTTHGGIIEDFSELEQIDLPGQVLSALQENFHLGELHIISVESVGPKVGQEMKDRALNAILFSLLGMLVYIAFRFRPIFGLAAIVAIFHDVFITLAVFSLTHKEISLTVIAALLTLVGYSINDTIVIFDRVRENLLTMRRTDMASVINTSINQTLNRTILTSGGTLLAVSALYLLGGEVLSGFSFALLIGIIVGTYSSIAIASPIVLWWQNYQQKKKAHVRA